jgi:hypothetical protein
MASPFRTFRKNQKAWMVVLTLLCMFSFVFFGQWSKFGNSAGQQQNPEVFSWKYGSVTKRDLIDRMTLRRLVNQFITQVELQSGRPPQTIRANPFPLSEGEVVMAMLLDKKAEQLGIVISDDMIKKFIAQIGDYKVDGATLADIAHQLSINQGQLFDAIRFELGANKAYQMFADLWARQGQGEYAMFAEFRGDTPADRWNYYNQLNRKVTAQVLPVAVKDFTKDIPDPSPEELRKFYDQYKDVLQGVNSPVPGFKRPFKAQFQYVKADNEKLLKDAEAKVTDEEIKDYYEKHKDEFKKSKLSDEEKSTDKDQSTGKPEKSEGGAAAKPADQKPADNSADKMPSDTKSETKPADSKPAPPKVDGSKSADSKGADKKSTPPTKPEPKTDSKTPAAKPGDAKKSDAKKSSSIDPSSQQEFVSLDGEMLAQVPPAAAPPKSSAPQAKADPKSASAPKAPDNKASDAKAPDTKAPETKTSDATETPPVEYEPLDKVHDQIRKLIAQNHVNDKVHADFAGIKILLDRYRRSLDNYNAAVAQGSKTAKRPEPPALGVLAEPYGLEAKETPLITDYVAYTQSDIGKSYTRQYIDPMDSRRFTDSLPFVRVAFQPSNLKSYQADETVDNDQNQYLWWKVADEAEHVPTLDEVKKEVIDAWKAIQARKPALAKAKEDAARANKDKQTLKEVFAGTPDADVSTIGPFSWLTGDTTGFGGAKLTEIAGIEGIGNDFMKVVFDLKSGQAGVATNESQTVYYVVQVESEEPPLDELRDKFMTVMSNPMSSMSYARVAAGRSNPANANLAGNWYKELQNELGFHMAPNQALSAGQSYD